MMDGAGDTVTKSKDIGAKDRREQPPPPSHSQPISFQGVGFLVLF